MPRGDLILVRRGTAADWTATNPVLAAGEQGYETDTLKFKVGDGNTPWVSLDYTAAASSGEAVGAIDGGKPNSNYGATTPVTGGKP